jgi:ferredoxin
VELRIEVDRQTCIGSGNCVHHAPGTFDLDDDVRVVVLDPSGDPIAKIRAAADFCPSRSITLVQHDTEVGDAAEPDIN